MPEIYHVTVERDGDAWRAICPALRNHGAVTGGGTREEALTHMEGVLVMILSEITASGATLPPDEGVPDGIPLIVETG